MSKPSCLPNAVSEKMLCHKCGKRVYANEKKVYDSKPFHPACVSEWIKEQQKEDQKRVAPQSTSSRDLAKGMQFGTLEESTFSSTTTTKVTLSMSSSTSLPNTVHHWDPRKGPEIKKVPIAPVSSFDIIVVGAGLAGLTTAYRLASLYNKAGIKKSILLTDAYGIGGRTKSIKPHPSNCTSVGGTWCIFEDDDLLGLAMEVGCLPKIPKLALDGDTVFKIMAHPYMLLQLWLLGRKWTEETNGGKTATQDKTLLAMDKMSLREWLDDHNNDSLTDLFFDTPAAQNSVFLWFAMLENLPWDLRFSALFAANTIYGRLRTIDWQGIIFPQTLRWEDGTGKFVEAIIAKLEALGVVLQDNLKTIGVDYTNKDKISVNFIDVKQNQFMLFANKVVFAIASEHAKNIDFQPQLPIEHRALMNSMQPWQDVAYNVVLYFKSTQFFAAFDRRRQFVPDPSKPGLIDPHHTDSVLPIFAIIMDLTEPNSTKTAVRFLIDPVRVKSYSDDQLKDVLLEHMETLYPGLRWKKEYDSMWIHDWSKLDTLSCAYIWPPDGNYSKYFPYLVQPINNRIFWAGSERSQEGAHWMEGAVHSGNFVAQQIADQEEIKVRKEFFKEIESDKKEVIKKIRVLSSVSQEIYQLEGILTNYISGSKIRNENLTENEKKIYQEVCEYRKNKDFQRF